jgi:hypothetical protein
MPDIYSRQSFLGENSTDLFNKTKIGIIGLGGGGSHIAQQLAHLGISNIILIDPDNIEFSNLNRTVGATYADALHNIPKVIIAERLIRSIQPNAHIISHQKRWQEVLGCLRDCDVIISCIDGFSERIQLEVTCRRVMIPLIDIGMDVHKGSPYIISGQIVLSMPGYPCYKCMNFIREADLAKEGQRYGLAGPAPQVIWANGVLASTAIALLVQLLTPWSKFDSTNFFIGYEGNGLTLEHDSRLQYASQQSCTHFASINDLGDPFWKP